MRVPGFIVAQVHLDQIDTRLHQSPGHQQGPAERIAAIAIQFGIGRRRDVEGAADLLIGQQRDCRLSMPVEFLGRGSRLQLNSLVIDPLQQFQAIGQPTLSQRVGQRKIGSLKQQRFALFAAARVMKLVFGKRTVGFTVEGRCIDEPRFASRSHLTGELAGDDSSRPMDQSLGKHHCGRQIIAARCQIAGDGRDRGPVAGHWLVAVECRWRCAATGQHDVMAERMIVRRMRQ